MLLTAYYLPQSSGKGLESTDASDACDHLPIQGNPSPPPNPSKKVDKIITVGCGGSRRVYIYIKYSCPWHGYDGDLGEEPVGVGEPEQGTVLPR